MDALTTFEKIALGLAMVPIGLGLMVAAFFGVWIIGTAIYYLLAYGRLP